MNTNSFNWEKTSQLSFIQIIIAFIIPSMIGFLGFRIVLPYFVNNGKPPILAYIWVGIVILLIFNIGAVFLIHRDAKKLNVSLWERMCMKKLSLKKWIYFILFGIVTFILVFSSQKVTLVFIDRLNLQIPDYMPFFLNPQINPATTDPAILSPDFVNQGSYFIIPLIAIFLLLNIFEFCFRSCQL